MTDLPPEGPPDEAEGAAAPDDAFSRLEKEMKAMKNAIGSLSSQISDAASDVGAVAHDQAKRGLKHARANVDSMVADASDRAGAVASAASMQASSVADAFEDVIRERPLSTVALALGFGFLVGAIWRR